MADKRVVLTEEGLKKLEEKLAEYEDDRELVTQSLRMKEVKQLIDKIAALYSAIYLKNEKNPNLCIVLHINHFKNDH